MSYTIDLTGRNDQFNWGGTTSSPPRNAAQTFTTVGAGSLTTVVIDLKTDGSPADGVELAIQADTAGQPTGTDLAVSTSVAAGAIPSSFGTAVTFTFPTPASLSATTLYWCIFRRTGSYDNTNNYVVGFDSSPAYAGGIAYISSNGVLYTSAAVDMANMTFSISTSTEYTETYVESLTLVDTINRSVSRTLTDVMLLVDTVTSLKVISRTFEEAMTLVDTISRVTSRTLTDVMLLVDTIPRTISRTLSDVMTLVDTITSAVVRAFTLTETITLVDSMLVNGSNVIWAHISRSAAATWTKISEASEAVWTKIVRN